MSTPPTPPFKQGQPLTAQELNDNFGARSPSPDGLSAMGPAMYDGSETWSVRKGSNWFFGTLADITNFAVNSAALFRQVGAGSVLRTIIAKLLDQPVSVTDYYNPATESWVTGYKRAIVAMSQIGGGVVKIPKGRWLVTANDMTQDLTPNMSQYRYMASFSGLSRVGTIGEGDATEIYIDNNLINSDSANQYWKGYQLFWGGSQAAGYTTANDIWFDNFLVNCNYANNQIAPVNSYGNQAQGAVFCFSYGSGYRFGDGLHIEGATGHQPLALYRGVVNVRIGKMRFTNCGQTSGTNANLTDQSSIYNEGDYYSIDQPDFWGPSPDMVSTAIEVHGNFGQVRPGRVENYNVGVIRAAMVSDSQDVVVRGGMFVNVTTFLQPDATAGKKLDVVVYDPVVQTRPKTLAGTRTPVVINTSSQAQAVNNQSGNYIRLFMTGAKCFSNTGDGAKLYIGGFTHELIIEQNHFDGYDYNFEIGLHAHLSKLRIRKNQYENMSGYLLNWASYAPTRDQIDANGTPPTVDTLSITDHDLSSTTAFTAILNSTSLANPLFNTIDLSNNKSLTYAPQPFKGNWPTSVPRFLVRGVVVNGVTTRLFASHPDMDVEIRDIGNKCTFFKQQGDTKLYAFRRLSVAPISGASTGAFLGTDYVGDIVELVSPTSVASWRYVCATQSANTGIVGTWSTMGTAAIANTGTSGGVVPLLNGKNTWSAQQIFNNGVALSTGAAKTGTYVVTSNDFLVRGDTSAGAFTCTLPSAATQGQIHAIKKIDSSANAVTVDGGGKNIDARTSIGLTAQFQTLWVQYNGTTWDILSNQTPT